MNKIKIITLTLSLSLYGCGDGNIDIVKNGYTNYDDTLTISQAFDNRKVCNEVDWTSFNDDRERLIIQYKCHINGVNSFYIDKKNSIKKHIDMQFSSALTEAKRLYNQEVDSQQFYRKEISKNIIEKDKAEKTIISLKELDAKIKVYSYKNEPTPEKFNELLDEVIKLVGHNLDRYQAGERLYTNMHVYIRQANDRLRDINYHPASSSSSSYKSYEKKLKSPDEVESEYNSAITEAENGNKILLKNNESNERYNIIDVYEVIQFTINKDKVPEIIYTGIVFENSNGGTIERKRNENSLLKIIYKNKATGINNHWLVGKI